MCVNALVRICAEGIKRWASLPRPCGRGCLLESSFHQRIDLFWGIVKMSNGILYLATLFRVALPLDGILWWGTVYLLALVSPTHLPSLS